MTAKLIPALQEILDCELAMGNEIASAATPGLPANNATIVFQNPLHRKEIEAECSLPSHIEWYSVGGFCGYVSKHDHQSIQGPVSDCARTARAASVRLSLAMRQVYDREIGRGNEVVRVEEFGSEAPLAISFRKPLQRVEATDDDARAPLAWWESRDPHYPKEAGYRCRATGQTIAGPLD
jgi:hypothetical protein